jgi:hypothetical protein
MIFYTMQIFHQRKLKIIDVSLLVLHSRGGIDTHSNIDSRNSVLLYYIGRLELS